MFKPVWALLAVVALVGVGYGMFSRYFQPAQGGRSDALLAVPRVEGGAKQAQPEDLSSAGLTRSLDGDPGNGASSTHGATAGSLFPASDVTTAVPAPFATPVGNESVIEPEIPPGGTSPEWLESVFGKDALRADSPPETPLLPVRPSNVRIFRAGEGDICGAGVFCKAEGN